MIIQGFEFTSRGNAAVRVSTNNRQETFSIVTHNNLPFIHSMKCKDIYHWTDSDKMIAQKEIEDYIQENGTQRERRIVFQKEFYHRKREVMPMR
jgi:hypothetical protein